jgi:hypothetical protein
LQAVRKIFSTHGATASTFAVSIPAQPAYLENTMQIEHFIPISLFVCITLAIKFVVDARVRKQIAESHVSTELVQAMLKIDDINHRLSALKWGIVLTCLGLGLGLVDALNFYQHSPGAYGILIGACGAGLLIYHALASRQQR